VVKRSFAGRLAHDARNEEGLRALIAHFFSAPVAIESFVGSWLELDAQDRFAFRPRGVRPRARLGQSITVGERVWSREAKFTVRIGPLGLDAYRRLLPGGESLRRLRAIVLNYAGETLDWELNLVLRGEEVPETRLGVSGALGWTTWVGERAEGRDADELRLSPMADPGVPGRTREEGME
jgi:type VI secretion system protein ImpH